MSIIDKVTSLLPWRSERRESRSERGDVAAFRDDLDRWLQQLFADGPGTRGGLEERFVPAADVRETDDEVVVTLEVPGLDRDDLDITVARDGLLIRGDKREEHEDKRRDFYLAERRYQSFVRTVPLPPGLDLDHAEARVKHGVLRIRVPKAAARPGRVSWPR